MSFWFISPSLLLLDILNALEGRRKPHAGSLESRSDLPPDPPMVQTRVIINRYGVFGFYLFYN